jgi:transposase-like protein
VYLYRAVDSSGATIDFLLSAKRDAATAQRFLTKALGGENHPEPRVINTDKYAAYPPAIVQLKEEAKGQRQSGTRHRRCSIDRPPARRQKSVQQSRDGIQLAGGCNLSSERKLWARAALGNAAAQRP